MKLLEELYKQLVYKDIRIIVQDLFFASRVLYTPFAYFVYYSGVYFICLLALGRLIGLVNRYIFFSVNFSNIIFFTGLYLYLAFVVISFYIFIKQTFINQYTFTEEFFKEKALQILHIQKTNYIYKVVLYILYIFDAQDFVINNVRFGRFIMSYYLVLFLYNKYGLKRCLLGIRKFHLDRDFYEKIRFEYTQDSKYLHQALLEGILEKLSIIPEGEEEYMTLEQTLQYWNTLIFLVAQGTVDSLKKEQSIAKDFNAIETFFDGFIEIEQSSKYGTRLDAAELNANKKTIFYDNSKLLMFSYNSTKLLYLSLITLWFIPQIKYLRMKDKNFIQIYKEKLCNINIETKNFIIKHSLYLPKSSTLVNLNPHFHFFFKPGVTRTMFDLFASKKIDAGFVGVSAKALYRRKKKRTWVSYIKLNRRPRIPKYIPPRFKLKSNLKLTKYRPKLLAYQHTERRFQKLKFKQLNLKRMGRLIEKLKNKIKTTNNIKDKRKYNHLLINIIQKYKKQRKVLSMHLKVFLNNKRNAKNKSGAYVLKVSKLRAPDFEKAIVDSYVNERVLDSLRGLGINSINRKNLEIARRLTIKILKNLKQEDIYNVAPIVRRFGRIGRRKRGPLNRPFSYSVLSNYRIDYPTYYYRFFGYELRKRILDNYSINWVTGHTYTRHSNNIYDKKSLRADWSTSDLNNKVTSHGKSLGFPIEKSIYSHALMNYPGDFEEEDWHDDQLIAELTGSEDNFVLWYAILQKYRYYRLLKIQQYPLIRRNAVFEDWYNVFYWPSLLWTRRVESAKSWWRAEQKYFTAKDSLKQLASPIYHASIRTRHSIGGYRYLERTRFLSAPELVTHDFLAVVPDPENPKQPFGDLDILYEYRYGFNTYDYDDASLLGYNIFPLGEEIWGYTGYHKSIDEMIHLSYKLALGPGVPRDKCLNLSGDYGLPGNIYTLLFLFKVYIVIFVSLFLVNKSFYKWVLKMFDWLFILFIVILSILIKYCVSKKFIVFFVILQCFEPLFGDVGFINLLDFIATTCEINDGRFIE